jgi:hypothetical protein
VRRVAKPKMPTMSLGLTSAEGSEVVEMSKVKERDVEHLTTDVVEEHVDPLGRELAEPIGDGRRAGAVVDRGVRAEFVAPPAF